MSGPRRGYYILPLKLQPTARVEQAFKRTFSIQLMKEQKRALLEDRHNCVHEGLINGAATGYIFPRGLHRVAVVREHACRTDLLGVRLSRGTHQQGPRGQRETTLPF
jgi:hypothetical protein